MADAVKQMSEMHKRARVLFIAEWYDPNVVMECNRKAEDVARELGVSKSLVKKIRRGEAYREVNAASNPFAGLMR